MPKLLHKESKKLIAENLIQAETLWHRVKGLIDHPGLKEQDIFWIPACPSIHTFFMKFPIDVVFTDKKLQILSLFENVPARRLLLGRWGSQNAFEMKVGQIKAHQLKKGDSFYVEH